MELLAAPGVVLCPPSQRGYMGGRHGAGDLTRLAASVMGRGLHSSTFQLNLSRFRRKIHTRDPVISADTPQTSPTPQNNPYMHPLSYTQHSS